LKFKKTKSLIYKEYKPDNQRIQVPQTGGPKALITFKPLGGQVLSKARAGAKLA
jgi:hypothetical protein